MPMTRPAGLTHLLPGEQSVSNSHAHAWTAESTKTKAASVYFGLIFLMAPPSRELALVFVKSQLLDAAKKPVSLAAASRSKWSRRGFGSVQQWAHGWRGAEWQTTESQKNRR